MAKKLCSYLALIFTFLLGSHNGYIALWKTGGSLPLFVYPYSVHSLPSADHALLKAGIPIESLQQLQVYLEDYLS